MLQQCCYSEVCFLRMSEVGFAKRRCRPTLLIRQIILCVWLFVWTYSVCDNLGAHIIPNHERRPMALPYYRTSSSNVPGTCLPCGMAQTACGNAATLTVCSSLCSGFVLCVDFYCPTADG